jgi:hypothetical protein
MMSAEGMRGWWSAHVAGVRSASGARHAPRHHIGMYAHSLVKTSDPASRRRTTGTGPQVVTAGTVRGPAL